jgi:hypothetical protein
MRLPGDALIDALGRADPPSQARLTVRTYLSNLRRVLGDGPEAIVSRSNGYALEIDPSAVDAFRFERLVTSARTCLEADPSLALGRLDEALGLWRGEALADAADSPVLRGDIVGLEELRRSAQEDRCDALLALGRAVEVVALAQAFVANEPLRERARAQLMLALHRVGRTPDALRSFREFRELLVEELGLDPAGHRNFGQLRDGGQRGRALDIAIRLGWNCRGFDRIDASAVAKGPGVGGTRQQIGGVRHLEECGGIEGQRRQRSGSQDEGVEQNPGDHHVAPLSSREAEPLEQVRLVG